MNTLPQGDILNCGHPPDAGKPYNPAGDLGWQFVLDGDRRICHACADARILECGHPPSPHSDFTTGYGTDLDGNRTCYECCAVADRAMMVLSGQATLYLCDRVGVALDEYCNRDRAEVTNWPGSLRFPVGRLSRSKHGGGFGSQRTDAWFDGPDGFVWHAVNRGDMQIARCKRTKTRARP